ncbi:MAG: VOC family protein [Balneolaceae bacterium]|nr:VOC family protein [Balneolaceae bacterium]
MKFTTILLATLFILSSTLSAQSNEQEVNVKINHIAISVTNLQESEHFYRDILGLKQIPEPFGLGIHAWFDIGSAELHVIEMAEERKEHSISSHLCFSVRDMDAFIETLAEHNIPFYDFEENPGQMTLRPDGISQIYITDPDGYWVEINDDF